MKFLSFFLALSCAISFYVLEETSSSMENIRNDVTAQSAGSSIASADAHQEALNQSQLNPAGTSTTSALPKQPASVAPVSEAKSVRSLSKTTEWYPSDTTTLQLENQVVNPVPDDSLVVNQEQIIQTPQLGVSLSMPKPTQLSTLTGVILLGQCSIALDPAAISASCWLKPQELKE